MCNAAFCYCSRDFCCFCSLGIWSPCLQLYKLIFAVDLFSISINFESNSSESVSDQADKDIEGKTAHSTESLSVLFPLEATSRFLYLVSVKPFFFIDDQSNNESTATVFEKIVLRLHIDRWIISTP